MKSNAGFTLVEVMIAMIIMAIIGLLSWRGLDGTLRAKEAIEQRITEHQTLQKFISLWQNDCKNIPAGIDSPLPGFIKTNQNFWLIKHISTYNSQGWQIVLYRVDNTALKRLQTDTYASKNDLDEIWQKVLKNPDVPLPNFHETSEIKGIVNQVFEANYQNQTSGSTNKSGLFGLVGRWQFEAYSQPLVNSCLIENQL